MNVSFFYMQHTTISEDTLVTNVERGKVLAPSDTVLVMLGFDILDLIFAKLANLLHNLWKCLLVVLPILLLILPLSLLLHPMSSLQKILLLVLPLCLLFAPNAANGVVDD